MAKNKLVSLDFEELKQSLKDFLKNQSEFTDYNFEGSGLNVLLDVLAYNSQNKAYLANMLANEMFLDSAILRSNVVSCAKSLGYTPKSITASKAVISISINDPGNVANSLLLPRGTKFLAGTNKNQFTFVTLNDYNLYLDPETGLYTHPEIEIYEGTIRAYTWDVDVDSRFVIPHNDVDTSTIRVVVYDNAASSSFSIYERVENLLNLDGSSEVFWVYETDGNKYEIKFGDNVFGKKPQVGNMVYAEYLTTKGPEANGLSRFSLAGSFAGYENADISLVTVSPSNGGDYAESVESIKINAPRKFSSKGKAVTTDDYKGIIAEIFPYAKSVEVWGGEDVNPVQYGKVFISIIPKSLSKLTSVEKTDLLRKLKSRAVVGITPEIVDPNFTFVNMTANVLIKRNFLDIGAQIREIIINYFQGNLGVFNNTFYYTNLTSLIQNASRGIVSCNLDFTLSKVGSFKDEKYEFYNPISPGSVKTSKLVLLGSNVELTASDDGQGNIVASNGTVVGTVDYPNGVVTMKTSTYSPSFDRQVEVFVETSSDDITPGFANVIILNEERLSVQLKAV